MTDVPAFLRARRKDVHSESRTSQFAYVSRKLREVISDLLAASALPPGARVLDYGCADRPYEHELPTGVTYVGADLPGNDAADVVLRPDGSVPLPDGSFDLVLSTQVLEHVEETALYLGECNRLLRPGGTLVLSTHGIMYYHQDPEDYWRWTKPGLTKVLGEHGFAVEEARGVLALAAAAVQIFQDATMWKVPRRLQRPYALVNQLAMGFIDGRYEEPARVDNCLTLAMRATKSDGAEQ
jgi:SAM-dependent methyltransferase